MKREWLVIGALVVLAALGGFLAFPQSIVDASPCYQVAPSKDVVISASAKTPFVTATMALVDWGAVSSPNPGVLNSGTYYSAANVALVFQSARALSSTTYVDRAWRTNAETFAQLTALSTGQTFPPCSSSSVCGQTGSLTNGGVLTLTARNQRQYMGEVCQAFLDAAAAPSASASPPVEPPVAGGGLDLGILAGVIVVALVAAKVLKWW